MDADTAAAALGVSKATLYAYVSRGLVGSRGIPGTRKREYRAADIEERLAGTRARRDPRRAVHASLGEGGLPVLRSSLSLIEHGKLHYRGVDVVELCATHTFEDVAALLWGDWPAHVASPRGRKPDLGLPLIARLQTRLARLSVADPAVASLKPPSLRRVAGGMVRQLAADTVGCTATEEPIATVLARGWNVNAVSSLESALILCADHELNVSAFTARCVASSGASLPMVVSAALGALSGRRHGGHTRRVRAMLEETGVIARVIARHLEREGELPGFGHPLYPNGDPRARALLELCPPGPTRRRARRFAKVVWNDLGLLPTLDFGLVTLAHALEAPADAPLALFALGRTVGWIAHALEQYASGQMIRPRAEYIGPREP